MERVAATKWQVASGRWQEETPDTKVPKRQIQLERPARDKGEPGVRKMRLGSYSPNRSRSRSSFLVLSGARTRMRNESNV